MKELEIQRKKQQMKEKIERAKRIEVQRQNSRPSFSTIIDNDFDSNSNVDVIKVGGKKRKRTALSSVISNDDHYTVGPKIEMDNGLDGLETLNGSQCM